MTQVSTHLYYTDNADYFKFVTQHHQHESEKHGLSTKAKRRNTNYGRGNLSSCRALEQASCRKVNAIPAGEWVQERRTNQGSFLDICMLDDRKDPQMTGGLSTNVTS